jgi:4-oxalocrotonate tautomerase
MGQSSISNLIKEVIMPVVIVEWWEGHKAEEKKHVVEGITSVFSKINIPPQEVHIIVKDNPKNNWATGGKLASEI